MPPKHWRPLRQHREPGQGWAGVHHALSPRLQIPVPVLQISATQHPVKAGLSDAFMILNPSPDVPGESLRLRNSGRRLPGRGSGWSLPWGRRGSPGIVAGRGGRWGGRDEASLSLGTSRHEGAWLHGGEQRSVGGGAELGCTDAPRVPHPGVRPSWGPSLPGSIPLGVHLSTARTMAQPCALGGPPGSAWPPPTNAVCFGTVLQAKGLRAPRPARSESRCAAKRSLPWFPADEEEGKNGCKRDC